MEEKHLKIIVRRGDKIICKQLCFLQTLTLLALLFDFCKWLSKEKISKKEQAEFSTKNPAPFIRIVLAQLFLARKSSMNLVSKLPARKPGSWKIA